MNLAFFTGAYSRSSDPYLRDEVAHLRSLGHTVHTFSVKRLKEGTPAPDVAREQSTTTYLLEAGLPRLALSYLKEFLHSPKTTLRATNLALKLGWPGLKGRLWPLAYLLEASLLAQHLRARHIDHLHNHHGENPAAVALLASTLTNIPYSLTIHGSAEWDRPMELHLDEKVARAAFVCAISSFTRSQIFRWTRAADWPKVHIVRCGVGQSFLDSPLTPPTGRTLVNVGRLCEQKGQLLLLEAAAQLARENLDFQLLLIGDGELRPQLEQRIDELHLRPHVQITGFQNSDQVRQHLLNSRAMVMSSFAEALPVVLMESLALGRPVISTSVAGIPELVDPNVTGWLVPPGSIDALTTAMRTALTTPDEKLAEMGRAGRTRIAALHSAATEASKKSALLTASLPSPAPSPHPAPAPVGPAPRTVPSTPSRPFERSEESQLPNHQQPSFAQGTEPDSVSPVGHPVTAAPVP